MKNPKPFATKGFCQFVITLGEGSEKTIDGCRCFAVIRAQRKGTLVELRLKFYEMGFRFFEQDFQLFELRPDVLTLMPDDCDLADEIFGGLLRPVFRAIWRPSR